MAAPKAGWWGGSVSAMKSQDTCLDGAVTTGAAAAAAGIPAVARAASGCAGPAGRLEFRAVGICPECIRPGAQVLGK